MVKPGPKEPEKDDKVGCTAKPLADDEFELTCPGVEAPIVVAAEGVCTVSFGGEYDSAEALETLRGCKTIAGDLSLYDIEDLSALSSLRTILGGLRIFPTKALVSLPKLHTITGELSLGESDTATGLDLPELTRIGELAVGLASAFERFSAPKLRVARYLAFGYLPKLKSLSLPSLEHAYDIDVALLDSLTEISLPALSSIGHRLEIGAAPELVSLDLGALTSLPFLYISDAPKLLECPDLSIASEEAFYSNACGAPEAEP